MNLIKIETSNGFRNFDKRNIKEIIGHYDISAVLRFFHDTKKFYNFPELREDKIIFEYKGSGEARFVEILLKDPNIYTTEENKNLLLILKKISIENQSEETIDEIYNLI